MQTEAAQRLGVSGAAGGRTGESGPDGRGRLCNSRDSGATGEYGWRRRPLFVVAIVGTVVAAVVAMFALVPAHSAPALAVLAIAAACGLLLLYRTLSAAELISAQARELERTNTALRETNADLDAFSYSVSHDLRAPLRAIDGFSEILVRQYADQLPAEGQRYIGIVRRNALEMEALIDGLLEFARLGQQQLSKREVDIDTLCRQAVKELGSTPDGERAVISVGSLPSARADPALVRQVLVNLLSNALKYSRGRDPVRVEVGTSEHSGETAYWVRDNGVGFDMRYADKLFNVFQRLHSAEYEGTGVGLALVARIVKRHGGRVWAEAAPDEGATFFFTLEERAP
jgi:light-regulated signal transduction histidine kinase (bacteriophytochrome)